MIYPVETILNFFKSLTRMFGIINVFLIQMRNETFLIIYFSDNDTYDPLTGHFSSGKLQLVLPYIRYTSELMIPHPTFYMPPPRLKNHIDLMIHERKQYIRSQSYPGRYNQSHDLV